MAGARSLVMVARIGLPFVLLSLVFHATAAAQVRVKDVARIHGVRDNDVYGYGLIVGLNGTGDRSTASPFTPQTIANMLQRLGIAVPPLALNSKNVAAVMVTAKLPPFVKTGTTLDVLVSSLGDSSTLQGGTLLLTPLQGPDGRTYALAQGPVSVGGVAASGGTGDSVQKNHPTVGRIPGGALVEREVPAALDPSAFSLTLLQGDFTTAVRLAEAVNGAGMGSLARAINPTTVTVSVPPAEQYRLMEFISRIEALTLRVDAPARVIINERTGTVVLGSQLRIATVAIAHGNLIVQIKNETQVSQPGAFAPIGSQTVVVPKSDVGVKEEKSQLAVVREGASIGDVVQGLNSLGVTPRDLISILQAIRQAGALMAELEIM
ncbi:MAG TPA: flagellar basal body P-ring protein FlgI [Terriglobales bacterium]|nr:flagellar basal body P-ring protein FlgI [Terriglobales bacterium]